MDPFEDLLDVLDLKTVGAAHISVDSPDDDESDLGDSEADIFVGRSQPMPHGRVFGGQVLAQSIIAAGRTVEDVDDASRGTSTACTATSCARATPATRSGSRWSGCATAGRSRPGGCTRSSTASRSCR